MIRINIIIVVLFNFIALLNAQPGFDDNVGDTAPIPITGGFIAVIVTLIIVKLFPEKND